MEKGFALGVWFSVTSQSMQVNFIENLENMKRILRAADSENQAKLKNAGRRGSADLNHISVG